MSLLTCLLLALPCGADDPAPFSCGPFLLSPGTDTMTIVVDHVSPVPAVLEWGPAGGARSEVRRESMRHHIFRLEELAPGTRYTYQVTSGAELASALASFRTLPVAPESYRLVVLGDVRSQPARWERVARRVFEDEREALFVIGTGDYPADGRMYAQWVDQFFAPARDLLAHVPMWPAIGNHERTREASDVTAEELSQFFSLFELPGNERWYRVDYRFVTLLVLDSNSRMGPGSPQYEWLRSQLRSRRGRFTLAAFHHAPFTSGPHGGLLPDGTPREWPLDEGRRFLAPLFEMYGVDLVLNGHDHLYERSHKGGVVYVVTGGGGAPLYRVDSVPNRHQELARAAHHYVTLDVTAEKIEVAAVLAGNDAGQSDGEVFDRATIEVRSESLARRSHFLESELAGGVRIGAFDAVTRTVPYTITNTLREDLVVTPPADGAGAAGPALTLAPGASHSASVDLADTGARPEPWRGPHVARLEWRLSSRDQELPVSVTRSLEVALGPAYYPVGTLDAPELDGEIGEWRAVPALTIDAGSHVVQRPTAYSGGSDCSAWIRFARSEEHLFVAAVVTDDDVARKDSAGLLRNDGVHLLFASPADVAAGGEAAVVTHSLLASGTLRSSDAGAPDVPSTRSGGARRDGGYVVEAAIPLARIPVDANGNVAFDVIVSDRDAGPGQVSLHRAYSNHRRQDDPSQFGLLRLDP